MSSSYVPEAGDLIWLNFTPHSGHEQAGRRPALVLSPARYNAKTGMLVACPVTSRIKNYPFEVLIRGDKIEGAVLSDQVKSVDWRTRSAAFIESAPTDTLQQVRQKLSALVM